MSIKETVRRVRCILKGNSQKTGCQTKAGGSMWWRGFTEQLVSHYSPLTQNVFQLPLPLSHTKSLSIILSPPWISILGIGCKARNLKGLLLFSINHQTDKNRAHSLVTLLLSKGSIYRALPNELKGKRLRKVG